MDERTDRDELLSVDDVAHRLGVQAPTVQRWCREGRLPCLKPGKSWRIRQSALDGFLRRGEHRRTLVDHLRSFILVPDHVIAVAEDETLLERLDAAFFQVGEARGALLVKFLGGDLRPIPALREAFQHHGLDVHRLEVEGRFRWSLEVDPSRERDAALRRLLTEASAEGRGVWASFNWTREVDLDTMLRQHKELAALVDGSQLVVKTAAIETAADWSSANLREAQAYRRGIVRISRNEVVLSRATPLPD